MGVVGGEASCPRQCGRRARRRTGCPQGQHKIPNQLERAARGRQTYGAKASNSKGRWRWSASVRTIGPKTLMKNGYKDDEVKALRVLGSLTADKTRLTECWLRDWLSSVTTTLQSSTPPRRSVGGWLTLRSWSSPGSSSASAGCSGRPSGGRRGWP